MTLTDTLILTNAAYVLQMMTLTMMTKVIAVTLRLHAGHGLSDDELLAKVKMLLETLAADGGGLKR